MSQQVYISKPISEMLAEINFRTAYSLDEGNAIKIEGKELNDALGDISSRLSTKLKTGICSQVLKGQLVIQSLGLAEKFGDSLHKYHFQTILDTIAANEDCQTVNIRDFTRNPLLRDYKHIHHNSSTYIQENVFLYWRKKHKGRNEVEYQNELLNEVYQDLLKTHGDEFAMKHSLGVLLNKIHNECIFREFKNKTGEWIVCVFKNNKWYYLCLASHNEGDDNIVEKIKKCLEEFPELI